MEPGKTIEDVLASDIVDDPSRSPALEPANAARLVSVALIVAGIVGLKLATPA